MRSRLRSKRRALSRTEKESVRLAVTDLVREHFPELHKGCIGFYWPFQGEVDLRNLVGGLLALGAEAALPVVVEKRQPLAFWSWRPGMKLERGIWNIPVPHEKIQSGPRRCSCLCSALTRLDIALATEAAITIVRWRASPNGRLPSVSVTSLDGSKPYIPKPMTYPWMRSSPRGGSNAKVSLRPNWAQ